VSEERAFEGVWISASLWLDKTLTMQEKVMLVEIKSLSADPVRGCYKSNKAFAEFFGVSTSRVSQILSSLEEKGYISLRHKREGKRVIARNIFLSEIYSKNQPDLFRKPKGGYLGNLNNPVRKPKEGYLGFLKERNTILSNTVENKTIGQHPEVSEINPIESEFEQLWKSYPKRAGANPKGEALKVYRKQRKSHPPEEFQSGLERYRSYCEQAGKIGTEFVMQAKRFFGAGKHWQEGFMPPVNHQQGAGNENRNTGAAGQLQQRTRDRPIGEILTDTSW